MRLLWKPIFCTTLPERNNQMSLKQIHHFD
jgi:hypothetical protein